MAKTGLVVGKFYPPHRGHRFLIDTAQPQVDHLIVLVCERSGQTISGEQRATWLRELHPAADIRVIPDIGHDDDSRIWAEYTKKIIGFPPDAVFSSEEYGPRYAKLMGSQHVMVDQPRATVPISATEVRKNPWAAWPHLEPCVRAYFTKRVCVLGAESTGTTTLAQTLAKVYRTVWVPEYGRTYSQEKYEHHPDPVWTSDEFAFIAKEQRRQEDEAARRANRLLICDTNAFATGIWHERYMGHRSALVERVGAEVRPDLYLLTDDTIPFVQDGWRDSEHLRHWMHVLFQQRLDEQPVPWQLITGNREARVRQARRAIDQLFAQAKFEDIRPG